MRRDLVLGWCIVLLAGCGPTRGDADGAVSDASDGAGDGGAPEVHDICGAVAACDPSYDETLCLERSAELIARIRTSGAALCDDLADAQLDVWRCLAQLSCAQLTDPTLQVRSVCPTATRDYDFAIDSGARPCLDGGEPVDVPSGWSCSGALLGDGHCECGCGAPDPDCPSGVGCTGDGCRAAECELCVANGQLGLCFDFCGPCSSDADCPFGVCVNDPDGPGTGFCTASCDLLERCGPIDDPRAYCGSDGNCLTALTPEPVCAADRSRGGVSDACGNFVDPVDCAADQHCAIVRETVAGGGGSGPGWVECTLDYPDGTRSSDATMCQGGLLNWFVDEPEITFCSALCGSSAECDPGTRCSTNGRCVPIVYYYCGADPSLRLVRDGFGTGYPALAMACSAGTKCVDATTPTGNATCEPLLGDGQDCTSPSECAGGLCISTAAHPSIQFCSRTCSGTTGCPTTMTCSSGACVPRIRESCSADFRQRIEGDSFGRTYGTIETCSIERRCTYTGTGTRCADRCTRSSGCSCYAGFCTCCGTDTYYSATMQCCQTCDSVSSCIPVTW